MMVHAILVFSIDQDGFDFLVVVHAAVWGPHQQFLEC